MRRAVLIAENIRTFMDNGHEPFFIRGNITCICFRPAYDTSFVLFPAEAAADAANRLKATSTVRQARKKETGIVRFVFIIMILLNHLSIVLV